MHPPHKYSSAATRLRTPKILSRPTHSNFRYNEPQSIHTSFWGEAKHAVANPHQSFEVRCLEISGPGPRRVNPYLPHHVPLAPSRRQRNPTQAPNQNLFPNQRRRPRRNRRSSRPAAEARLRLVPRLLSRSRPSPSARNDAARNASRSGRRKRRTQQRRPTNALALGPQKNPSNHALLSNRHAMGPIPRRSRSRRLLR